MPGAAPAATAALATERGERALAAGQVDLAKQAFEAAVADDPRNARALFGLGYVHELQQEPKRAEQCYRQAIARRGDFAEAHNNLGVLLRTQGKLPEAIEAFRAAAESDPNHVDSRANLALALEEQGRLRQAAGAYKQAIARKGDDPLLYANYGLLLLRLEQVPRALATLRRGWDLEPTDIATLQALGNGLRIAGDAGLALAAMRRALDLAGDDADAALVAEFALAQYAAGYPDRAKATLAKVTQQFPSYATARYLLGKVLAKERDNAQARIELKRYLEREPAGLFAKEARRLLASMPPQSQ